METHTWRYAAGCPFVLETKYRDIADGNLHPANAGIGQGRALETRYRDIADGNMPCFLRVFLVILQVGNQVPRYSGWKLAAAECSSNQSAAGLETRYRDIADGNLHDDVLGCVADEVCWEPRGFLARMQTRNPITTYPRPNMRFAEIEERTQLLG